MVGRLVNVGVSAGDAGADNARRAFSKLDAVLQLSVESATTTAQPGAPTVDAAYIIPAGKTGTNWASFSVGQVAVYRGTSYTDLSASGYWEALTPNEGWRAFVRDEDAYQYYTGASVWAPERGGAGAAVSCKYATAAALASNTYSSGVLTASANGALAVDGAAPAVGDRILVKDEVSQLKNGVYVVTSAGSAGTPWVLTRAHDFTTWAKFPGALITIEQGTANADTVWLCTANQGGTLGTTAITFGSLITSGGALGTPASGNLANCTALPQAGVTNLGTVRISTQAAAAVAAIDFTGLDGTYDSYELRISSAKPATNDVEAWLRVQTGGATWQTSGYEYSHSGGNQGGALAAVAAGGATKILITQPTGASLSVGNGAGKSVSGKVTFNSPDQSDYMSILFETAYVRALDTVQNWQRGAGQYSSAIAITGIRFMFSSGNIASGDFTLLGIRKS